MASTSGRRVVVPLTNKSGGGVIAGDVVIIDTSNDDAFTTTTSAAFTGTVGVAQATIANNAIGPVLLQGEAALVNVSASVTRGHYGATHTVAKQAASAGASRVVGTFVQFKTGGTTPKGIVFNPDLGSGSGNVATDAIWDAAGDLAVGSGANTATRLAIGAADTVPRSNGTTLAYAQERLTFTVGPWYFPDLPASATTQMVLAYMNTTTAIGTAGSSASEVLMTTAGKVVGAIMMSDAARVAGTAIMQPRINGTPTAFNSGAVTLDGTNTLRMSSFVAYANGLSFSAAQQLGVAIVTSSWSPTTANILVWLVVSLDV